MTLKLKTPPVIAVVALSEAKLQCRVDHTDDDSLLTGLIAATHNWLEGTAGILGRCLISQSWELYYDEFPSGPLQIPLGNLLSVTAVDYIDPNTKIYVTWPQANNYDVDAVAKEGWIMPSSSWPTPASAINAIRITFVAGYGPNASDVPAAIKQAMLMLINHWYENRGVILADRRMENIPLGAQALLLPFTRVGV